MDIKEYGEFNFSALIVAESMVEYNELNHGDNK